MSKTSRFRGNPKPGSLDPDIYSAEDADSLASDENLCNSEKKKAEGAFYVWEQKEINHLLGDGPGEIFLYRYGVKPLKRLLKNFIEYEINNT
ncbi:MAG: hypothetical protein JRE28_15635 [Deltaproteobacteria bacterium]|nr:hypothetical protein [Deltaproteobacteria bacterium]